MLQQIIEYRNQGLSFRKIAKEMNTTVGKVQYQWVKYQKTLEETKSVVAVASEKIEKKPKLKPKRQGKYKGRVSLNIEKLKPLKAELTVMFSEPTRVLCYWNIPGSIIKQVRDFHRLKEDQFYYCLRVFDITSISFNGHNHHSHTDIIIHHESSHWFINSLKPNRSYCVEYGIVDESGQFTGITRSSVFHTPRTGHDQEYHQLQPLHEFEAGITKKPQWVEHVSTYSYYLKN
ncbi:DUF4912 domain-containing protein [Bacillus sp. SG-1]|uniref:DUF4912 domain-containing protein n=1 Tax=Bacillus sp. SG-1 TaxID=161544 RepID=UPI000319A444|nr:DUF4912 domain-containing protein [Bacillus sp. SG-1]